jgi:hypothetical protein
LACIHCEKADAYIPRIETLLAESPGHVLLRGVLGYAFALNGQAQRANAILDAITHPVSGEKVADPYAVALVLIGLNERHDAVQWLEQSYRNGSLWSIGFPSDPILKSLRDEPGFRMFLGMISYPIPRHHSQMSESSSAILLEALRVTGA